MIVSFETGFEFVRHPLLVGCWLVAVGALMVSRLPTFSFKKSKVPQEYVLFILVAAGLLVAGLAGAPWRTLTVVGLIYVTTLPFAYRSYHRLRREAERMHDIEAKTAVAVGQGEAPAEPEAPPAAAAGCASMPLAANPRSSIAATPKSPRPVRPAPTREGMCMQTLRSNPAGSPAPSGSYTVASHRDQTNLLACDARRRSLPTHEAFALSLRGGGAAALATVPVALRSGRIDRERNAVRERGDP